MMIRVFCWMVVSCHGIMVVLLRERIEKMFKLPAVVVRNGTWQNGRQQQRGERRLLIEKFGEPYINEDDVR